MLLALPLLHFFFFSLALFLTKYKGYDLLLGFHCNKISILKFPSNTKIYEKYSALKIFLFNHSICASKVVKTLKKDTEAHLIFVPVQKCWNCRPGVQNQLLADV